MVQLGEKVLRTATDSLQYFFLNFLPWCEAPVLRRVLYRIAHLSTVKYLPEWFPGVAFPKVAREGRQVTDAFRSMPYDMAKKQFVSFSFIFSCSAYMQPIIDGFSRSRAQEKNV